MYILSNTFRDTWSFMCPSLLRHLGYTSILPSMLYSDAQYCPPSSQASVSVAVFLSLLWMASSLGADSGQNTPARECDLRVLHSLLLRICSKAQCYIMQCPLVNGKQRMDEHDSGERENVQMLVAHNVSIWRSARAQRHHQRFVFGLFVLSQQ